MFARPNISIQSISTPDFGMCRVHIPCMHWGNQLQVVGISSGSVSLSNGFVVAIGGQQSDHGQSHHIIVTLNFLSPLFSPGIMQ